MKRIPSPSATAGGLNNDHSDGCMRIYLQTPYSDERPPRFYHLFLQEDLLGGWSLVKEWGFQGASGRVQREFFDSREEALAALIASRDLQVQRGYRVMFFQGDEAPR